MALHEPSAASHSGASDLQQIIDLAAQRFTARGTPVTLTPDSAGLDTTLVAADGVQYPLFNLIQRALMLERDSEAYFDTIFGHVDALVGTGTTQISDLSDADFMASVRVRLTSDSLADLIPVAYARPFAPGVIVALCIDQPTTVGYVNDGELAERNFDLAALFDRALANVMAEPIDSVEEVKPGLFVIEGDSYFTASKALGMLSLVGSAFPQSPSGVVFGVPHRHLIVAHPIVGLASLPVIGDVATLVANQVSAESDSAAISPAIYFWHEGVFEEAGRPGENGEIRVMPGDRLLTMLNSLS